MLHFVEAELVIIGVIRLHKMQHRGGVGHGLTLPVHTIGLPRAGAGPERSEQVARRQRSRSAGGDDVHDLERASALSEVAGAAAATDPELAAIYDSREILRVEGYRGFVQQLTLPAGVDAQRAADILLALHSAHLYQALRKGRGWTDREVSDWMADTIPELVIQPAPNPSQEAPPSGVGADTRTCDS